MSLKVFKKNYNCNMIFCFIFILVIKYYLIYDSRFIIIVDFVVICKSFIVKELKFKK